MAKAIAECTCTVCGKHFTRFRWCNNRREADSWEEWASTYFDKCPSCYRRINNATHTPTTPRDYACDRRALPFGAHKSAPAGMPDWCKARGGLIAVTDGTAHKYVAPGLLFGVEIIDGVPSIVSYWRAGAEDGLHAARPYSLNSVRQMGTNGQIVRRTWPLSYEDMVRMVRNVHPDVWVPDPIAWYAEYGLTYDEATGEIRNPLGLCEGDTAKVKVKRKADPANQKQYYVVYGDFSNVYRVLSATPDTVHLIPEDAERITLKEARRLCSAERERRKYDRAASGFASAEIEPVY